jgi:uncharacterized integral membrane protein
MTEPQPPAPEDQPEVTPKEAKGRSGKAAAQDRVYVGTGFYWPVLVGLILLLAVLALVVQNTQRVDVQWLWLDFRIPLIALLLVAGLTAALLTELVGWIWRRRRRRILRDREELKRLRG